MKFIIIDDEVHTDKFEGYLDKFKEIYQDISKSQPMLYFCKTIDRDDISRVYKSELENTKDKSNILCFTDVTEIKDDLLGEAVLISIDLKNNVGASYYVDFIRTQLGNQMPVFIIALSGDIETYREKLDELTNSYPYFKYYEKDKLDEQENEVVSGCKAIWELQKTVKKLRDTVNVQAQKIYPDFLQHADIIANDPKSGTRYMTSVVKEALYDGKFLDTTHQSFESYVPVNSEDFTLICNGKRQKDSDFRYGLIFKKKNSEEFYINVTPSCNINGIIGEKIQNVQLTQLTIIEIKNSGSLPLYKKHLEPHPSLKEYREINYTCINSISVEELCNDYKKVTILVESVAKDLQHSISSYYGRQGSIKFI